MKMVRVAGVATTLRCVACGTTGVGGTEPYASAATGKTVAPEEWYVTENESTGPYCMGCAGKIAEAIDPTRSVTQFYSNTTGKAIDPEHL